MTCLRQCAGCCVIVILISERCRHELVRACALRSDCQDLSCSLATWQLCEHGKVNECLCFNLVISSWGCVRWLLLHYQKYSGLRHHILAISLFHENCVGSAGFSSPGLTRSKPRCPPEFLLPGSFGFWGAFSSKWLWGCSPWFLAGFSFWRRSTFLS